MHILARLNLFAIGLFCFSVVSAQALDEVVFEQRVVVTPENPTADDEIVFRFTKPTGVIDKTLFAELLEGQRILLGGTPADTIYEGSEFVYSDTIGPLPVGNYTIEIHSISLFLPFGPDTLVGTRQLQVAPGLSSAIRVPTLSGFGLAALVVGVVLIAGFSRRL